MNGKNNYIKIFIDNVLLICEEERCPKKMNHRAKFDQLKEEMAKLESGSLTIMRRTLMQKKPAARTAAKKAPAKRTTASKAKKK